MPALAILASTLVTALGEGRAATLAALRDRRSGLRPCDFRGVSGGHVGRIAALDTHRLPDRLARYECRNNRLADLALSGDGFRDAVAAAVGRHGPERIAVIIGTSTSGIQAGEDAYAARDAVTGRLPPDFDYAHTQDMFSAARFVREALALRGPASVVSTACASSGLAFADAHQLILSGVADAVVVGGVDTLCRMTLHGFAALELISPEPTRPCDALRSGISIGEAAGFALLERAGPAQSGQLGLLGYGITSDGHHMSAPHPEGIGAIGAMRRALERAALPPTAIDYINLHGTGTRANDAMEDIAVTAVFGRDTPCSSTKGWTGHTLGAAAITEALIAGACIADGFRPGCLNIDRVDPAFTSHVLSQNENAPIDTVVSNSFGFGGVNCSLVLGRLQ